MARLWDENEQLDEEEELVVTEHRDADTPDLDTAEGASVETTVTDSSEFLEQYGEDVGSSPAQRGPSSPQDMET